MKQFLQISWLLIFLLSVQTARSQVRFGAKIGAQITNVHLPVLRFSSESYVDPQYLPQVGVFMETPVSTHWSIISSAYWSPRAYTLNEVVRGGISGGIMDTLRTKVQIQYLEFPIMASYRFRLSKTAALRMGMGPYLAFVIHKSVDRKYNLGEYIEQFSSSDLKLSQRRTFLDYGGKASLGLEAKNILIEFAYIHGLADAGVFNARTYNRALGITMGYLF